MKQIIICYSLCSFCSHLGLSCLENLVTGSYCWIGFKQSTGRDFFIGSAERNRSRPFVFALQIYQSGITCYVGDRQGIQKASTVDSIFDSGFFRGIGKSSFFGFGPSYSQVAKGSDLYRVDKSTKLSMVVA